MAPTANFLAIWGELRSGSDIKGFPARESPRRRFVWVDSTGPESLGDQVDRALGFASVSCGLCPVAAYIFCWAYSYHHLAAPIEEDAVVGKGFLGPVALAP